MLGFGSLLRDYLDYYKISQTDFAERLGISKKHLNNIINGKVGISEELMVAISLITDIDIKLIVFAEKQRRVYNYLHERFDNEKSIKEFLNTFYLKDMSKLGWIKLKDVTNTTQNAVDLLEYLNLSSFDLTAEYINTKVLYKKKGDANQKKIYLWIKHCDKLIIEQNVFEYSSANFSKLLDELKFEQNKPFNTVSLTKILNKYGIYLVVEDALPATKIRGCMMVKITNPAIYLTKTFKEKASFYFALYHELAHVKKDYNMAKNKIVVDDSTSEKEIDEVALNWMIDKNIWDLIKENPNEVKEICQKNNIPICFATSRLAKEGLISYNSKIYTANRESIN